MKTTRTETFQGSRQESFEIKDSRGREIGGSVSLYEQNYTEVPDSAFSGWSEGHHGYNPPGTRVLVFYPHATRNGQSYGALQRGTVCSSEADREAKIARYFAGARKRALKLANRVGSGMAV